MAAAYLKVENRMVTCPYDEAHKLKESRLQLHIAKCKLNHLDKVLETCPFNATHLYDRNERDFHLLNCPDKAPLDRKLAQSLDKNNPFKGRTAVPSYSESRQIDSGECWDNEISNAGPGYVPPPAPPGAIIEPRPMAKPSERKQLYKNLHRMHNESENVETPSTSPKLVSVPRQPKQPSAAARLQNVQQQQHNMEAIQNLGLGRGKSSRIAANIWNKTENENSPSLNNEVSGVINGINNLGLGRGQGSSQGFVSTLDDDDEFPVLGCGRGAFKFPKQNPRIPGVSPRN